MTDQFETTEFRRAGRRVRTYVPGRVLLDERKGLGRRSKVREIVIEMSSVSVSGVAFRAPDTLDVQIGDQVVLCIGNEQAPAQVQRREGQLHGTTFYAVEFLALSPEMQAEIEAVVFSDARS